jgi:hypothetical protein
LISNIHIVISVHINWIATPEKTGVLLGRNLNENIQKIISLTKDIRQREL